MEMSFDVNLIVSYSIGKGRQKQARGPFLERPGNFSGRKLIFISSVSKNGEAYTPETSCMKGTPLHIKNK